MRLPLLFGLLIVFLPLAGRAGVLDDIGVTRLRLEHPTLLGTGVIVAQPEADIGATDSFEVNPATTGLSSSLFTYINSAGASAVGFPNAVGTESGHADSVGDLFYGVARSGDAGGVAPGVAQIYSYSANYFINHYIALRLAIPGAVVNQSFVNVGENASVDAVYDNYVARFHTVIVSGVGNSGAVNSPATASNVIAVAAYGGLSSVGPTSAGRSKPDLTAPASATSFSTPLVSGAAAVLIQSGREGYAGAGTEAAAVDDRTIKALLLNGATKPADWTHTTTAPLDTRYGAGVLDVYASFQQLDAGEFAPSLTNVSIQPANTTGIATQSGWSLATLSVAPGGIAVSHYVFDLSSPDDVPFTLTSTLVWEKALNANSINNLDLTLFSVATGKTVDLSVSTIDNVEHLFTTGLTAGRYDLQVKMASGGPSNTETYALAFNFASVPEPGAAGLLALGGTALACARRRRPGCSVARAGSGAI